MAGYPSDYESHVVLRDGGLAFIRPIKPEEASALDAMFHPMGRDSVYNRFFRHKDVLTEEELTYFANVDYEDRMAFVVEVGGTMVGGGRYTDFRTSRLSPRWRSASRMLTRAGGSGLSSSPTSPTTPATTGSRASARTSSRTTTP